MVRVVLDTNVFVSALFIPDSFPARILEMILTGTLELVMSREFLPQDGDGK
jgi:predicted nucleic acid-binding protein